MYSVHTTSGHGCAAGPDGCEQLCGTCPLRQSVGHLQAGRYISEREGNLRRRKEENTSDPKLSCGFISIRYGSGISEEVWVRIQDDVFNKKTWEVVYDFDFMSKYPFKLL
jgi:hypothetical protein